MSNGIAELAILDDVCSLPAQMQKIYLQLVSAIDMSLLRLRTAGAAPEQLSDEFIDKMVDQLLEKSLTQKGLQDQVNGEFMRQILQQSELSSAC